MVDWVQWLFIELRNSGLLPDGPVAKPLRSQCRGLGSPPGQGTRFHMPQLKGSHDAAKDPTCRNWDSSQPNKYINLFLKTVG